MASSSHAVLREKDLGTFEEPAKMTVNEHLDHWLETSAKGKVRPQTFEGYKKGVASLHSSLH
ncbi:hypothetical protein [Aneurinibacillus danicus]|uniref:Core-binding (CB) domain-containing protein n=1 Tax=Aneurinibacillus danicus TaxID=267746 RepID=A0A511V4J6_9BACL|nr:hypothetical protein [Aneurinibacillus danicus]GEN32868.1 hypothetical protein ADA01nite_03280 [Aneurinibacillus danicus]